MNIDLKDYQDDAVAKVLTGLRKGSAEFAQDQEYTAVSLSAPTGAGKTVIAAGVIERMLFGDSDSGDAGDDQTVFLWVTDDPSLNEQTRKKIQEASDRIQPSQLVPLNENFDQPVFDGGHVYFLNIQKLASTSRMVLKKEGRRNHTLWQTITNTISQQGQRFYLIIDEAHRGTRRTSGEATTMVYRLMNGDGQVAAAPVVLGISATPERFESAVAAGSQQRLLRKVPVPVAAVRESGLIKDVLSIAYRGEAQTMETTLVRQAVTTLRTIDGDWNTYTEAEGEPPVRPALVLQVPPNISPDDVGVLLDVCVEEWDELAQRNAFGHSLESHTAQEFGEHTVGYVQPQDIQDHPSLRVIVFKEALTTGWDCPRAEVMVSLRTAHEGTYIAQLIGRMVRSPLARRIESDLTLNRVTLILPNFDRNAVETVKAKLENDDGGLATDVEINSVDARRNSAVSSSAFTTVESLPSYQVPGPVHRSQVARLHKLAALLIGDGLLPGAIKTADEFLISVLQTEAQRLSADGVLQGRVKDIETASVEVMDIEGETHSISQVEYETDVADVNRLFATAKRKFKDGLADLYWGSRVTVEGDDPYDAKVRTYALSTENDVVAKVEDEAAGRVRQWLDSYGDAISQLSEDRKAKYAEVRAMASAPELVYPGLPTGPITMSGDEDIDAFSKHLYSNANGIFRTKLGSWEKHALEVELERPDFHAWYRNPTGGQRALRIPFETGAGFGKLYPDLVVLQQEGDGTLAASIVDPHGHHLGDAGDKLRGLASYAEKHGQNYRRIIGIIKNNAGDFRMLDLKDPTVRSALAGVNGKEAIEQVFSDLGANYN